MSKKLNKFEKTRILSARGFELADGAKAKIDISDRGVLLGKDYVQIAREEFDAGLLDLEIYEKKPVEEQVDKK